MLGGKVGLYDTFRRHFLALSGRIVGGGGGELLGLDYGWFHSEALTKRPVLLVKQFQT